ncbi:Ger(x)C family spore germination protein [Peribacillus simplex]|uniref:Spore germination protein B3 n=1 Tax=Peribacillus simplex TaxID=1478 RepID=A0A9W4KV77_9BACI|nr:Ger(x)C family spore germination protein [Peribacillus simplex]CAH0169849.1 Spore germination protein B3 [Peribacillus simplex]
MKKWMIILSLFLLTGCWDKIELEEQAFVVVVGLDKGENGLLDVTYQIANPQVGSTDRSKADKEKAYEIVTLSAPNLTVATQITNVSVTRNITLSHVKALIVGEELAKDNMFLHISETITKERGLRENVLFLVSKEKASEFIKHNKTPFETRPHKFYDLMGQRWKETGFVPLSTYQMYLKNTQHDAGAFLAIYSTAKNRKQEAKKEEDENVAGEVKIRSGSHTQSIGSVVFKNGKAIDKLTGEETRLALMLQHDSDVQEWTTSFTDPIQTKEAIGTRIIIEKKAKINVNTKKSSPVITATVPVKVDIVSVPSLVNYSTNLEHGEKLKSHIEKELERKTDNVVKKSQNELKVDIFEFYYRARRKFLTMKQYERYNWMKSYPNATVIIDYEVELYQFGEQVLPTNRQRVRD